MKTPEDSHHMEPDYFSAVPAGYYGYVAAVAEALSYLPDGDGAVGHTKLEVDNVPILWDGVTAGYLVLSEIDGATWDYCPAIVDKGVHPDGEE